MSAINGVESFCAPKPDACQYCKRGLKRIAFTDKDPATLKSRTTFEHRTDEAGFVPCGSQDL